MSCQVCQEFEVLATLYLDYLLALHFHQATLRDEVMSPSIQEEEQACSLLID